MYDTSKFSTKVLDQIGVLYNAAYLNVSYNTGYRIIQVSFMTSSPVHVHCKLTNKSSSWYDDFKLQQTLVYSAPSE